LLAGIDLLTGKDGALPRRFGRYLAYVAALCGLLVGVCWLKGEPQRWHNDERA
jgi:hypothetical protein